MAQRAIIATAWQMRHTHPQPRGQGMPNASADEEVSDGATQPLFFSYARADQARILPIIRALEASGHGVWWDGLIESGARFAQQTEAVLHNAPAVVVAWSATSIASHWVNDEAAAARDRGVLVPVSIDGSVPPMGFRQFQVIDLSGWAGDVAAPEFQRVLRGIEAAGSVPSSGNLVAAIPASSSGISRRALMLGGAGAAGALALGGAWYAGLLGGGAADRSIAVLPFENIGGGEERDYFVDGLAAELRSQLSRNAALRVIAQSSSAAAVEEGGGAAAIARRLGVAFLLEGNVRWDADTARIAVNLIDRATAANRWSKTFDLTVDDIFAVQSEIAAAATAAITSQIVGGQAQSVGGTRNAAAYDQFLRGRDVYTRASSEDMDMAALAHFDAAIAADPNFAAAHAARASSLTLIGSLYGDLAETRANYAAALVSARRAVALAPDHAGSQSTLGYVFSHARLDIRAARAPFERARELGVGDANVLTRYANYAALTGRFDDARAAVDRAITLDPLNPLVLSLKGSVAYWAGNYAEALELSSRALRLLPRQGEINALIGNVFLELNRFSDARIAFRREISPVLRETGLAIAAFKLGQRQSAQASRQRIVTGLGIGQVTHYQQAQIAAQWNEPDVAIAALGEARQSGDSGLVMLKVDPLLEPLRARADFTALLTALHFD
jgi:TolB-like protein/Tfp pilus assembly protein PilF